MTNVAALRLRDDIAHASEVVAPSWPLSSTIAVNPIAGFEDRPFSRGIVDASMLFGTRGLLSIEEFRAAHRAGRIPRHALAAALDRAVPDLTPDDAEVMLADLVDGADEPAPRRVLATVAAQHDADHGTTWAATLARQLSAWCARGELPPGRLDDPIDDDAADQLVVQLLADLDRLRVPPYAQRAYLQRHLAALPGWVSHLRWRERTGERHVLLRFLAAAVAAEADLVAGRAWFTNDGPVPKPAATPLAARTEAVAEALGAPRALDAIAEVLARLPGPARAMVWQDAYERVVHDRILAAVAGPDGSGAATDDASHRPGADVVCCIDVRSEVLRRHLEARGDYRTHGYAGFFGLAARVELRGGGTGTDQCPVLIAPGTSITVDAGDPGARRLRAGAEDGWQATKHHPIAPLALAEGAGWVAGPLAALRTAFPGASRSSTRRARPGPTATDRSALSTEAQADVVAALVDLGIGPNPAPLVVLCGHTSQAANNPTESGLTCGACGGNGGGPNARAVAAMANDPEVRSILADRGLAIPDDTWFVGAEHDTALDRVEILDPVPSSHDARLAALVADLEVAGDLATAERASRLPGTPGTIGRTRRRAFDWAEPVAELGLAGNAAFVIGPRSMTAGTDFGGRTFLHSYEPGNDPDGATLAGILTAPLVVAQWINAQYHFSTTDPEEFGAGSKALHNVLGDVGVLSGPGGDLRRGLALQSVRAGDRLLHEPVRLLAVVWGRRDHIDAAVAGSPTLRRLVDHEWLHLVARQPDEPGWMQRTSTGWSTRHVPTGAASTTEAHTRETAA